MRRTVQRIGFFAVLLALAGLATTGCGSRNSVPSSVPVTLPDGTTVNVTMGAGVISLADTVWDFYHVAGNLQGAAFVRIRFDSEGSLAGFENNTIASEIFGDTVLFDGQTHETSQAGLSYAAATYGAETSDSTGFTFEGRLTAYAAGFEAAAVTATAMAEFDPEDPNVVRGTFSYTSEVLMFADMFPQGNMEDEFPFMGQRVID